MTSYPLSETYDKSFLQQNMMGPNAIKLLEELGEREDVALKPGMRVLDLGCGRGLTSIFLAKEYGVNVFALDLWTPASENYERFKAFGLEDKIVPIHGDVTDLPFADGYFDALVTIDSYHYFGRDETVMDTKIAPYVKPDGQIIIAVPGMKCEFHSQYPDCMLHSWSAEDLDTIRCREYWQTLLEKSSKIHDLRVFEMVGNEELWQDWLLCENSYAVNDRKSMEAGAGEFMNFVGIIAKKLVD